MTRCNPIEFRKWCGTAGTEAGKGFRGSIHRPMIVLLGVVEEPYFSYYNWLYLCIIYIYICVYIYIHKYDRYIYIYMLKSEQAQTIRLQLWFEFEPLAYFSLLTYYCISYTMIIDSFRIADWLSLMNIDDHRLSLIVIMYQSCFFFNVIHWLRPILMTHIWWFPES